LVESLPAAAIWFLLSLATSFLWPFAAVAVLVLNRLPRVFAELFTVTLRYQLRLAAYHLSLVSSYPSLSEKSGAAAHPPQLA
jgi:hypothetical protein